MLAGRVASSEWGACTFICLPERGRGIAPIAPSSASTLGFAGRNGACCGAIRHRVFRARRCVGRVGRNGRNFASALGSRGYLYVSAAAASLVAGDLDPEGPQHRGEAVFPSAQRLRVGGPLLALRHSLTDDLFQPAVEIARRTFPRLALLLFHERPDSINVLFAKPCSPVGTGNGPVGRSAVERPLRSSVLSIPASSAPAHR